MPRTIVIIEREGCCQTLFFEPENCVAVLKVSLDALMLFAGSVRRGAFSLQIIKQ